MIVINKKIKKADKDDEMVRVLDPDGVWTGKYKTRKYVDENGVYYANVAVWIFNIKNKSVLIEHRSDEKRKNPGKWCLVGGHVALDETPTLAAINEVKEEIGIKIGIEDMKFLCVSQPVGKSKSYTHHFYVLLDKPLKYFKIQEEEVTEIRYIKYDDWKKLIKTDSKKVSPHWDKYSKAFNILDVILAKYKD